MKRNLKPNQYELDDGQRESLWQDIRRETTGVHGRQTRRRVLGPTLAITAVAASLVLMVVWQVGNRQINEGAIMGYKPVASREKSMEADELNYGTPSARRQDPVAVVNAPVAAVAEAEVVAKRPPKKEADRRTDHEGVSEVQEIKVAELVGTVDSDASPGKLFARGGRSGEVLMNIDGSDKRGQETRNWAISEPASPPPSVTGGTAPPNGEQVELMYFESAGVNPFVATEEDALSTFALDVDNASWTLARGYLDRGLLPPRDAIRVEEFVNAFDAGWTPHTDQPFRIHTEGAQSRFGQGYHLLRIGLVGQDIDASERKPANLIFVIDVSGSMARESRLGLVKKALHILLDELGEGDRVGIVVYGSTGQVRLALTDVSQREKIAAAIDALQTNGSTNAAEGLQLAYKMARENYDSGIVNRLILCSDGVANTGVSTEAGGILDTVRRASDEGITLSTIGFGMGNYNDVLMEKLANQGDGNYYYVDKIDEAQRIFHENLTGLLQTIAREVKVQVEFDEKFVQRWRLLGYENRDVADQDFRNDQVDAGEVGVGHQVTALYELKLTEPTGPEAGVASDVRLPDTAPALRVGTVRLRHEAPAHDTARAGQVTEIEQAILMSQFQLEYAAGSPAMRVQTVVAEFAEILRGSYWAKGNSLVDLVPMADALARELASDKQVQELAQMIRQAADIHEVATGSNKD